MKLVHKQWILAGMLTSAGMLAYAQAPATNAPGAAATDPAYSHEYMGHPDPAKMREHQARRQAELKEKLKLTAAQEGAWTSFTEAMQMRTQGPKMDRAAMEKLTTPQRLDKMREMREQHTADASKRDEAIKTFYASLTPEQQKTFDATFAHMGPREGRRGGERGGPRGGTPRAPAH